MFTRSVRVSCSFQDCRGESVKYETCLIFLRPLPTLVTDPNFIHLATGMSVNLTACRLYFLARQLIKQACLYQVSSLSQIWSSRLYVMTNRLCGKCYSTVGNFSRLVCNCSRQSCKVSRPVGNFYQLCPRVGKFYN